ncbi:MULTISPECIES: DUF6221 family protein [Kitasatospora]|uniref:DUF6221 family protein n=1 Tax=Kitasatospora TaxID=2063 RepID=UPI000C705151|nr:DUF6221 family protein [Kitasatospora sp. GP30]MDH6139506.1 hypothetical protein [Kitasatospora sp. GP30]
MNRDILSFLHARLDEDADLARRCDGGDDCCGTWLASGGAVDFCQYELPGFHPTTAAHVASHDPERVLREVAAKRRVLARHRLGPVIGDPLRPWDTEDDCQYDGFDWPCPDVVDLLLPYIGHPEFGAGWPMEPQLP